MDQLLLFAKENPWLVIAVVAFFLLKGDLSSILAWFKPKTPDPAPTPPPVLVAPVPAPVDERPIVDAILKILPTLLPVLIPLLTKELKKDQTEPPK